MSTPVRLHGVVLRTTDYGEAHRMVTLLTEERGLVSAFAPGARSSRRRFGGALELFTLVLAEARERRGDRIDLESVSVVRAFPAIREDLARIACAGYACDLAGALVHGAEPVPSLSAALLAYLGALDAAPARPSALRRFELAALRAAGLAPRLDACSRCGAPVDAGAGRVRFDPSEGGVLCAACAATPAGPSIPLGSGALAALVAWSGEGEGAEVSRAAGAEARDALAAFIEHHLGRRLPSRKFLDDVSPLLGT